MSTLEELLDAYKAGTLDRQTAIDGIRGEFFQDLGHSTLDHDRLRRTGAAEVVYGLHKTAEQIQDLVVALHSHGSNVLVTRVDAGKYARMQNLPADGIYNPTAQTLHYLQTPAAPVATQIAVVTAGTSDAPVAEEAAVTAEFLGNPVTRISDVGVAGIHRLFDRLEEMRQARVLVVVAGMEGALPSVVGGLVDQPVIAVPTSVGYGAGNKRHE